DLALDCADGERIVDRRLDLAAMADDPSVGEEAGDVTLTEARDPRWYEVAKCAAEVLALVEDREPREPRLEALQPELLEDARAVGDRSSPLLVVVRDVERIRGPPPAPGDAVRSLQRRFRGAHGAVSYPTRGSSERRRRGLKPTSRSYSNGGRCTT